MNPTLAEAIAYVIVAGAVAFIIGWAFGFMNTAGRR